MIKSLNIEHLDTEVGKVDLFVLKSKKIELQITSYGAAIYDFSYNGISLVVKPDDINDFLLSNSYYGKTIGRTSGRLSVPNYQIKDKNYEVKPYGAESAKLHGGKNGFSFKNFEIREFNYTKDCAKITLGAISFDGEEDYPGILDLNVIYEITRNDEVIITYKAISSKDTLCNITNHSYFNLNKNKDTLDFLMLKIDADKYLDITESYQLQEIRNVKDTNYDFRASRNVIEALNQQKTFKGFDHTYLFSNHPEIELYDKDSKMGLVIHTDYPAVVFYTHNYPESVKLKDSKTNGVWKSIALECQYEPDGIHDKRCHDAILEANQEYKHFISFKPYQEKR